MSAFREPLPRTPFENGGQGTNQSHPSESPHLRAEDFYQDVDSSTTGSIFSSQYSSVAPIADTGIYDANRPDQTRATGWGEGHNGGGRVEYGRTNNGAEQPGYRTAENMDSATDDHWLGAPQFDSRGRPVSLATGIIGMYASSGSDDETSYLSNAHSNSWNSQSHSYENPPSLTQPSAQPPSVARSGRPLPPRPLAAISDSPTQTSSSRNLNGDGSIDRASSANHRKALYEAPPWSPTPSTNSLPAAVQPYSGTSVRPPGSSPLSALSNSGNYMAEKMSVHPQQERSLPLNANQSRARAPLPTPPGDNLTRYHGTSSSQDYEAMVGDLQTNGGPYATRSGEQQYDRSISTSTLPRSPSYRAAQSSSGSNADYQNYSSGTDLRTSRGSFSQTHLQGPPQIIEQRPSPELQVRTLDDNGYPRDEKTSAYTSVTSPYGTARSPLPSPQPSQGHTGPTTGSTSRGTSLLSPLSSAGQAFGSSTFMSSQMTDVSTTESSMTSTEYVNFALLSNLAVLLRDDVPRGDQIKGSVAYPGSFTGRDVVSSLQALIPAEVAAAAMGQGANVRPQGEAVDMTKSRHIALLIAKSLKSQLFFHEVDWGEGDLRDGVEDVYMFLGDTLNTSEMKDRQSSGTSDWATSRRSQNDEGGKGRPKTLMPTSSAAAELDELPTGIFTPLTPCYSPLCGKPGAPPGTECYSAACPRARVSALRRNISTSGSHLRGTGSGSTTPLSEDPNRINARAWAELVPKELLETLPKTEIARQNAIHETIQKEEEYLADLELLEDLFVKGLEKPSASGDPPPIPIGPYRDVFLQEVFSNHRFLASRIRALVERLHIRQREQEPVIQSIGDIFLAAALDWSEVYHDYIVNFPLAKSRVKREAQINPRFKSFLEACRRNPLSQRHELESFLIRPTTRIMRYLLHLESILKKTDESNEDRDSLERAMEVIDDQIKSTQSAVAATGIKVKIRDYAWGLETKRNKAAVDMDLLNPERQLVHEGEVFRKPRSTEFDWTDLHAVLFDNYLIVTKPTKNAEGESESQQSRYVLAKRPIPVEMLELLHFNEPSLSRSIGLSSFHIRSNTERETRELWPFTVNHIGGKLEPLTLYTTTKAAREEWRVKLEEARGLRAAVQEANKVFEHHTLSDSVFALPSAVSIDPDRPPPGVDPSTFHGRVTCAVPFATQDGRRLVAIGCADGVWIGLRHDASSLRRVLHLKHVTQCAVLEPFGIFVVLADKVLRSFSLDVLVPSATTNGASGNPRSPQRLSGKSDVVFFSVGVLKERTLLVYMKRRTNESVFHALEPVIQAPRAEHGRSGGNFFDKFHKDSKNDDVFRLYKSFFIPTEAYTMQFLKAKLCIVCARGFEIMNLDSLRPGTIPDFSHCPRDDHEFRVLQRRVETAKPLGMFKSSDSEFLLCYNDFACYGELKVHPCDLPAIADRPFYSFLSVDRVGVPIRMDNVIEWEGRPHSVAFEAPYVLAFDSRFVEVRDCNSGRLVQIIRGSDVRYVSGSGTVAATNAGRTDITGNVDSSDGSIIMTQRRRVSGRHFDYQSVVELVPSYPRLEASLSHSNTISSRAGWI